jgi:sugar O-acyltransferase (sialic acid O-acetyltransferase NeuD family)
MNKTSRHEVDRSEATTAKHGFRKAIYGPGGFGRELIFANSDRSSDGICFISDDPTEIGGRAEGVPIFSLEQFAQMERSAITDHSRRAAESRIPPLSLYRPTTVVIAVADSATRRKLAVKLQAAGLTAGDIVAPTVVIGAGVTIGEGAILCDHSTVTASAIIGSHFQCNIYSYVAHDCVIGDFVTLAPRVCVNGNVVLEDDAYIGTGAVIRQGVTGKPLVIGRGAVVGMGAVVTKDVSPHTTVVGNPAREMVKTA